MIWSKPSLLRIIKFLRRKKSLLFLPTNKRALYDLIKSFISAILLLCLYRIILKSRYFLHFTSLQNWQDQLQGADRSVETGRSSLFWINVLYCRPAYLLLQNNFKLSKIKFSAWSQRKGNKTSLKLVLWYFSKSVFKECPRWRGSSVLVTVRRPTEPLAVSRPSVSSKEASQAVGEKLAKILLINKQITNKD